VALRRRARSIGEVDDAWSLLDLDYGDVEELADELSGYGPDVIAEQPTELVDAVIARLRGAAAAHEGAAT
jgi:proteasome accessory factor B